MSDNTVCEFSIFSRWRFADIGIYTAVDVADNRVFHTSHIREDHKNQASTTGFIIRKQYKVFFDNTVGITDSNMYWFIDFPIQSCS